VKTKAEIEKAKVFRITESADRTALVLHGPDGTEIERRPVPGAGRKLSDRALYDLGAKEVQHDYDLAIDEAHRQPRSRA
jgi:hypothetical protein